MIFETNIPELKLFKKGKVRDVYDLGQERLLIVATDRISCYDVILPTPIPDKGKILTRLSLFWFSCLSDLVANHFISNQVKDLPELAKKHKDALSGRFVITKKCKVIPFECVVRGYISGSGWKEYQENQSICGVSLPSGLKESDKLLEPIFTPATKAEAGHDENINFEYMANSIGKDLAKNIKKISIALYQKAAAYAWQRGIIIADTKFEFGFDQDKLILVDEVLTPDSSRFWPKDSFSPGQGQPSFDKQFVRDYLVEIGWDKQPPAPELPQEIVSRTYQKYKEALDLLIS